MHSRPVVQCSVRLLLDHGQGSSPLESIRFVMLRIGAGVVGTGSGTAVRAGVDRRGSLPLLHVQPDIGNCFIVRDQRLHVDRNNISIPPWPPLIGTTFGMGPENVPPGVSMIVKYQIAPHDDDVITGVTSDWANPARFMRIQTLSASSPDDGQSRN